MKTYQHKDTFWSQRYRSGFIQGCWNRDEKREEITVHLGNGEVRKTARTLAGAKRIITRHIGFPPAYKAAKH